MNRRLALLLAAAATLTLGLAACGESEDEGSSTMRPGENCQSCHEHSGGGHTFTLAGTVFTSTTSATGLANAVLAVTDASTPAQSFTMTSNSVGNFYTSRAVTFPVVIDLRVNGSSVGSMSAPSGACNGCHTSGSRIAPLPQ